MNKPTVFISYSHKDEIWKNKLLPHLKLLEQQKQIVIWDDRRIDAGEDWYNEIKDIMSKAAVAVCLISADYLSSDFVMKEEIPYLLDRRKKEGAVIIPVLIRPCLWEAVSCLSGIQMYPRDGKSVSVDYAEKEDIVFKDVAKKIYKVISKPGYHQPVQKPKFAKPDKIDITRLPVTGMELFGRQKELELLDQAWESDQTNVISMVAWGGVGKSTLVNKWLERMAQDNYRGAKRVFGWSFYSQGTGERVTSADQFINESLKWFGDPDPTQGSAWDKGQRLADLIRKQNTLMVLDGMEPLQSYLDFERGKIKDPALSVLITRLSKQNNGLCIITTKESVPDLSKYTDTTQQINLDQISEQASRALLRIRGVQGTDDELEKATKNFGSHALAINLLASYLHEIPGHQISHAEKIPDLDIPEEKGRHPRRVIEAFEKRFVDSPELQVLNILGLFDRPASISAINAIRSSPAISGLTDHVQNLTESKWLNVLQKLRNCRLLAAQSRHNPDVIDCHPLVREHFGEKLKNNNPEAWKQAHTRLYEYYKNLPEKHLPDTLKEMEPLFNAVAHGCQAGRYQETLIDVYWERIRRKNEAYSVKKLGAFGADLAAVSSFFEIRWNKPASGLTEHDKALVLNWAGFLLRAMARLREAVQPMQASLEFDIENKRWRFASIAATNLSGLHLTLGDVDKAKDYARQSVDFADRSRDNFWKEGTRTTLADSLHQAGELSEAEDLFREAEAMQNKRQPEYPYLYSLQGFQFCDLLLSQGKYQEVQKRAEQTLKWGSQFYGLLTLALDKLSLGRSLMLQSLTVPLSQSGTTGESQPQTIDYMNQAVEGFRESGDQDILPMSLIKRAAFHRIQHKFPKAMNDLEEAYEIAERGSMGLYLADYHLEACRLHRAQVNITGTNKSSTLKKNNIQKSKQHLQKAKTMIEKTGYHRRDPELHLLQAQLFLAEGEKENAIKSLADAKKLFKKMGICMWDGEVEDTEKSALSA